LNRVLLSQKAIQVSEKANMKLFFVFSMLTVLVIFSLIYLFYDFKSLPILLHLRVPRYMLTVFCGALLAGIGSVFQVMFNNPLAEPYILGISSGAAMGSIIASLCGFIVLMPIFGFMGALLTMFLVWSLANYKNNGDKNRLLFTGIITGMFMSAIISLLMYLFQKDTAIILQILMGNTGHIFDQREWIYFLGSLFISLCFMVYLYLLSTPLNILTSGDEVAMSIGVNVHRLRKKIFFVSSILIGICVSYVGIVGFVGLIVPQLVRLVIGADQKKVFVGSTLSGIAFLLFCDFLAMHLTVLELPLGIITSFVGCPVFIYILFGKKR